MPAVGVLRPEALLLLVVAAILAALAVWVELRRRRALLAFAGRGADLTSIDPGRRRAKLALAATAVVLSAVALAGPYADVVERTVVQSGVDLVVALDVSQSMAVRDVDPDRLRAAKQFVQRLGEGLTQSRVALVLFAGDGIVRYPPTADPRVLGGSLDAVSGAFRPQGGSSLRSAVDAALGAFSTEARESSRRKAVVLVSDGEDTRGQTPDVEALRQRNVKLFTVAVGTPSGGPIPAYDRTGKFIGYLARADGTQITSRMDESAMRLLAQRGDGRAWRLAGSRTVSEVITEMRRLDATRLGEVEGGTVPADRYQLFLALAILALVADELLPERRPMPSPRWLRSPRPPGRPRLALPSFARIVTVLVLAAAVASACGRVSASEADELYLAGDHQAALDRYRALSKDRPEVVELHVNAGNALHHLGKYDPALGEYAFGAREGAPRVRAVASYQRGNTLFRMGRLEEAREAYADALRSDPRDRDAKFNIEVIDRALGVSPPIPPGRTDPGQPAPSGGPAEPRRGDPSQPGQDPSQSAPGDQPPRAPGSEGPQVWGPPTSADPRSGPTLADALSQFRSTLTPEEALGMLDALRNDQRGIQILIEGPPRQPPGRAPQDPTY